MNKLGVFTVVFFALIVAALAWSYFGLNGTPSEGMDDSEVFDARARATPETTPESQPIDFSADTIQSISNPDSGDAVATTKVEVVRVMLPPEGAAPRDYLDDLVARAKKGDYRAACRIAHDAQRCRAAAELRSGARFLMPAQIMRSNSLNEAQRNQAYENTSAREKAEISRCEGIEIGAFADAYEYQRLAAATGSGASKLFYSVQPSIDPMSALAEVDKWKEYAQLAPIYLEQLAREGNITALISLTELYFPVRTFSPIRLNFGDGADPVKAQAYFRALQQVAPEKANELTTKHGNPFMNSLVTDEIEALANSLTSDFHRAEPNSQTARITLGEFDSPEICDY